MVTEQEYDAAEKTFLNAPMSGLNAPMSGKDDKHV